jgi:predicted dehydrogenase
VTEKAFLIGFGRRARAHLDALRKLPQFEVGGVFDRDPAARQRAREAGLQVFDDLPAGLRAIRPELAILVTPAAERLAPVREVLAACTPRWLVVEKPLALNHAEGRDLAELCRQKKVTLAVAHQLPFATEFAALLSWIRSGRLGDIRSIRASCHGSLFDQGSHLVDLATHVLGAPEQGEWAEAFRHDDAEALRTVTDLPAGHAPDPAHAGALRLTGQLRTARGEALHVECGLLVPQPLPELGPWLQKRIEVTGTLGIAEAHVAVHARLHSFSGGQEIVETSLAEYEAALENFYRALLEGRTAHIEHELATLARLEALQQSAALKRPLQPGALPAPAREPAQDEPEIALSVIMPMEDHRGYGLRAIESWTAQQRCDPALFELIVLVDRDTAHFSDAIRRLLRPQDRLIEEDAANEMAHYDLGIRRARGRYVFLTEPHCIAEPQVVSEALAFMQRNQSDGLCGRSTTIAHNAIARMEARMFDEGFVDWSQPEHFAKMILRTVLLKRSDYLAIGGFQPQFDRFAEWLLAAELKRRGYSLHYAPGVGVAHLYSDNFALLDNFIQEFTDGECAYRLAEGNSGFCQEYFGDPPEWHEAMRFDAALQRQDLRALLALLYPFRRVGIRARVRALLGVAARLPAVLAGNGSLLVRYRRVALLAKLRASLPWLDEDERYRHFLRYWDRTTALCRVRYALAHRSAPQRAAAEPGDLLEAQHDRPVRGLHGRESWQGKRLRWCQPLVGVLLPACIRERELEIRVLPIGAQRVVSHTVFWMGNRVLQPEVKRTDTGWSIVLRVPASTRSGWLYWLSPSLRGGKRHGETRALSLPLSAFAYREAEPRTESVAGPQGRIAEAVS